VWLFLIFLSLFYNTFQLVQGSLTKLINLQTMRREKESYAWFANHWQEFFNSSRLFLVAA